MSLGHERLKFGGNRDPEYPSLPVVSKHLDLGLNQVTLSKVNHKTCPSQPLHGFWEYPEDFFNTISKDHNVIQVYKHWELFFARLALKHTFHQELEMGGSLSESYWHSDPPKIALMGAKGLII